MTAPDNSCQSRCVERGVPGLQRAHHPRCDRPAGHHVQPGRAVGAAVLHRAGLLLPGAGPTLTGLNRCCCCKKGSNAALLTSSGGVFPLLCGFYLFPSGLFFLAVKTDTHTQTYAHTHTHTPNKKDAINKSLNCRCNCYLKVPLPNDRCRCCTPFRIFAPCHRSPLFVPSAPDTGSSNRERRYLGQQDVWSHGPFFATLASLARMQMHNFL